MKPGQNNQEPRKNSVFQRYRYPIGGIIIGYLCGLVAGYVMKELIMGIVLGGGGGILLGIAWRQQWNFGLRIFFSSQSKNMGRPQKIPAPGFHAGGGVDLPQRTIFPAGQKLALFEHQAYLPDFEISIAVMINAFHGKCLDRFWKM